MTFLDLEGAYQNLQNPMSFISSENLLQIKHTNLKSID